MTSGGSYSGRENALKLNHFIAKQPTEGEKTRIEEKNIYVQILFTRESVVFIKSLPGSVLVKRE